MFDLMISSLMLVTFLPFMAIIAMMVRLDGGPAIYRHQRVGKHGQKFMCLKFRSMVCNSDEVLGQHLYSDPNAMKEWLEKRKLDNDPRITRIGALLRKTSLDELPQLINVIKGEMSIVGPRPITEEEMKMYGDKLVHYLSVTPGMTGYWQVSGRSGISYSSRVDLDAKYANSAGMHTDIGILAKTPLAVIKAKGAK